MTAGTPNPEAEGRALIRRVYKKAAEIARSEVVRTFGQAWRGGKLDTNYLSGHIPFLNLPLQRGRVTFSTTDIPANTDSATKAVVFPNAYPVTTLTAGAFIGGTTVTVASVGGLATGQEVRLTEPGLWNELATITAINVQTKVLTLAAALAHSYNIGDALIVVPAVVPGSYDVGWIAEVNGVASISNTGFTMCLSRRVPLTNSEGGTVYDPHTTTDPPKILAGNTFVLTAAIPFPTAYQAVPVVEVQTGTAEYTAVAESITTSSFRVRVTHTPQAVSGAISYSPTGITQTDDSAIGTTGPPSADITSDPLTRSDLTWGAEDASTSTDNPGTTNNTAIGHQHSVPPGTDIGGGTTGTGGPTHAHSMPNHHHEHHHAHDLSAHTHGTPAHHHGLTEPVDGGGNIGHKHDFAGTATAVSSDTSVPCIWIAWGTRSAPAVTEDASWIASCP